VARVSEKKDHVVILTRVHLGQDPKVIAPIVQPEVLTIDHAAKAVIPNREVMLRGLQGQLVTDQEMTVLAARVIAMTDHVVILSRVHLGQDPKVIAPIVQPEVLTIDHAAKAVIPNREVMLRGLPGQLVTGQEMTVLAARVTLGPPGLRTKDPPGQLVRGR
jgi:hypothetical protein